MEQVWQNIKNLLLVAIGKQDRLPSPLTTEEWEEVCFKAAKQSIVGIIFSATMKLPEKQCPQRKQKIRLAVLSEKISHRNKLSVQHGHELIGMFSQMGHESRILKGQTIAKFYPEPELRQSGDIDIWVYNNGTGPLVKEMRSRWKVGHVFYHHADVDIFNDHFNVEVHFMPSWMNNPCKNAELQRFFRHNQDGMTFEIVLNIVHIFRHFLFEGIGLRHILDSYFILIHSSREERTLAMEELKRLGIAEFTCGIMWILKSLLEMDDEYLLCPCDEDKGAFLMKEIFISGNFGKSDHRLKTSKNPVRRFCYRIARLSKFKRVARAEVFWAPFFKIWQYLWRIVHRY